MSFLSPYSPQLLSVLRIVAGLLFLEHGLMKVAGFPAPIAPMPPPDTMIMVAGWIELIGGVLIILGLFSRIAAFICSGEMAVAYWMVHAKNSLYPALNNGDAAILFCFVFLYIAAAGPGPIAVNQS